MVTTFSYVGLNAQGKEIQGQLQADSLADARTVLRGQGLRVMALQQGSLQQDSVWVALRAAVRWLHQGLSVRNSDLILFYRQMQLMLRAGHTILEALEAASQLAARPRLSLQLDRCAERIRAGSSFSNALAQETSTFGRIVVKLVQAGEASGELDSVFERLAAMAERRTDIHRQLVTALTYPGIVLLAAIGVITFLVTSVVPRFAVFLQSRGKAIPWAAKTLLDIADWLQHWGGALLFALTLCAAGFVLARRMPWLRWLSDAFVLRIPVVGSTVMAATMAQSTWTFGLLLKSRLTVLEALRSITQLTGNAVLERAFVHAERQVLNGQALAIALNQSAIPRLVRHMAAVGERSGEMENVMEALGQHYQKELDARVKLLSSMIEPVLTLLIGGVVGFVYYAFFQAVLAVSTGGG